MPAHRSILSAGTDEQAGGQPSRVAAVGVRELILVRHGESEGNVAAAEAYASGLEVIDVEERDADVGLSSTGTDQAKALGEAFGRLADDELPDVVWCSPFLRAHQTAELALETGGLDLPVRIDERLRDRELGVLNRLTKAGIEARYPHEGEMRRELGKFYHRPSGGESWADVALRVRSLLTDLDRVEDGRSVLLVCHDAVVMVVRYICEQMTERGVLEAAREDPVRNVAISRLRRDDEVTWTLVSYNDVRHVEHREPPVTEHVGEHDV